MKLLVTGGAGFIGSNFVHYWLEHHPDDSLVVLDKLTYAGNLENLDDVKDRLIFYKGDICDSAAVAQAMAGADTVVHFAAETHVDRSIMDPGIFVKTNVSGTEVLLEQALKAKVKRFHHVSTDEVFGQLPLDSGEKWNEASPYNPRSPYSASKAASDHLVRSYFHTFRLPITISNCSNNFGPYCFPEKFIALAITNLLEGKKVPLYGEGKQVREWLYVEDHTRGIEAVLLGGRAGETYFIGPEEPELNNLEVVKKILKLLDLGEERIEFVPDRAGHDSRYALDISKIKQELAWRPKFTFADGLKQTLEWYKSHAPWWKRIKSGEYQKYYQEQYLKRKRL